MLDDIAMRRPWNIVIKLARLRARIKLHQLDDGVTVVIVNWNTRDITADAVRAVQRLSPPGTKILLVDNASNDGSREVFDRWPGVRAVLLPSNIRHGPALDLAMCLVTTRIAVTLDSDALPICEGWLEPALAPLRVHGVVLAGSRSRRNFVHPIYLAVDVHEFVRRRLSFQVHQSPEAVRDGAIWGVNSWDTAELMTPRLRSDEVVFVERSENPAPELPGMTAGGVVYHHGGVSRSADGRVSAEALEGWRCACRALGLDFLESTSST